MTRRKSPLKVVNVKPARERAKGIETALYEACSDLTETHGDRLAGFVLCGIDMLGDSLTFIHIAAGPVGHGLLPEYIKDAVNRQIAIDAAGEDEEADSGTG